MLPNIEILGHTFLLYDLLNGISTIVMFFYMVDLTEKFSDLSPHAVKQASEGKKMLVGLGEILAIIALAFVLFKILNQAFADWFTSGNANYYGSLTAWFLAITAMTLIFRISPLQVHDMFAPALPIQLFIAKLACFCSGCCSGFAMPGSWYFNQSTQCYEFPVQLLEALVALGLFFVLSRYQRRNKISGSMFPLYLILYAASRFITEFFRADFPNVLGPFNAYQIMSAVYVFLGAALLCLVRAHHKRSS